MSTQEKTKAQAAAGANAPWLCRHNLMELHVNRKSTCSSMTKPAGTLQRQHYSVFAHVNARSSLQYLGQSQSSIDLRFSLVLKTHAMVQLPSSRVNFDTATAVTCQQHVWARHVLVNKYNFKSRRVTSMVGQNLTCLELPVVIIRTLPLVRNLVLNRWSYLFDFHAIPSTQPLWFLCRTR